MPDWSDRHALRYVLAALVWGAFLHAPGVAQTTALTADQPIMTQPNVPATTRLESLEAALVDGPHATAIDMLTTAGLGDLVHMSDYAAVGEPDWSPRPKGALQAQAMNLRLALTMLSQAYGSDDVSDVLDAQPAPDRSALVIRAGDVTLSDVRRLLRSTKLQQVSDVGPVTLTVPLVIWSGASLHLQRGEVLNLSRTDGAFLMNFGLIQAQDAVIASVGETNATSPVFTSFVTTADGGVIQAQRTQFVDLGFGRTQKFSGVAIMQGTIRTPHQQSWIEDSTFSGVMTVSISMARDVLLRGNHFSNMRGRDLHVSRSIGAQILLNVFSGRMRTNAIMLEDGSTGGRVAGNVVLKGKRAGIVVRNESTGVAMAHNIVWRRDGGGIALIRSDCGVISGNLVLDNGQKGIEVRISEDALVTDNAMISNHTAGLWVSAQPPGAITYVRDNQLSENGSGVSAAQGETILMQGNDFSHQFLQFLSGDLAPQSPHIARDMHGAVAIMLTAGGSWPPTMTAPACSD
jgi:mannuronan 5-epimerase